MRAREDAYSTADMRGVARGSPERRSGNPGLNSFYLRGYKDPHVTIKAISVAARRVPGLRVLRVPMHVPPRWPRALPNALLAPLGKLYGHFLLCRRLRRIRAPAVLVREFLTLPLLLSSVCLLRFKHRLWLLCHHNLAFAAERPAHRWALRALGSLGFRFVVFEDVSLWRVIDSGTGGATVAALPCPVPVLDSDQAQMPRGDDVPAVGLIGNFRLEKSSDWAAHAIVDFLKNAGSPQPFKLIIGTSDRAVRSKWAHVATTVDTTRYSDYLRALKACDVVVLPYDRSAYAYRVSGVLSEALACGCATVVPAVPGLREQVRVPEPVGSCYERPEHLLDAIIAATELIGTPKFARALATHSAYRGIQGVESALRRLLNAAA